MDIKNSIPSENSKLQPSIFSLELQLSIQDSFFFFLKLSHGWTQILLFIRFCFKASFSHRSYLYLQMIISIGSFLMAIKARWICFVKFANHLGLRATITRTSLYMWSSNLLWLFFCFFLCVPWLHTYTSAFPPLQKKEKRSKNLIQTPLLSIGYFWMFFFCLSFLLLLRSSAQSWLLILCTALGQQYSNRETGLLPWRNAFVFLCRER